MSWSPCPDPVPGDRASAEAIEMLIVPRAVDLGEMQVQAADGDFIFFDQMGRAEFLSDQGIDVRPHPHINLATVTYLFEGQRRLPGSASPTFLKTTSGSTSRAGAWCGSCLTGRPHPQAITSTTLSVANPPAPSACSSMRCGTGDGEEQVRTRKADRRRVYLQPEADLSATAAFPLRPTGSGPSAFGQIAPKSGIGSHFAVG